MNAKDAAECRTYVAHIFKQWEPHEDELADWLPNIEKLACSVDRWKAAVRAAHGQTRYHTPLFAEIRAHLQRIPATQDEPQAVDPCVHSGWWVVRRGTRDARELILRLGEPTYDDHCRKRCLGWITGDKDNAGLEELYPGDWTIIGPGCTSYFHALRINADFEARYQAAWAWACAKVAEPAQSADDWFAERARRVTG